jgi:spore coat polysaccharide biosynthesis protein SpsF
VLLDLAGATALQRCLDRVVRFDGVREVIVATTTNPEDDQIVACARRIGFRTSRGSTDDVLSRYVAAAKEAGADAVVRCTSDCPLLDPTLSSMVVHAFCDSQGTLEPLDYAANNLERRLPRGLDTEIVSMAALERAQRNAASASEREHVTLHVYRNPQQFRVRAVVPPFTEDYSSHRWTLDTAEDYRLLATIYERLGPKAATATLHEVLALFDQDPSLKRINAGIEQKPVQP